MDDEVPIEAQAAVSFSAAINQVTTEALLAVMADLAGRGKQKVTLLLTTPGGSVMNGMNLYGVLRGMPFELVTHNVGSVNSVGNVVFLAGDKRYASPHATFMFHGVGADVQAGARLEEKQFREGLDSILSDQNRMGDLIVGRTKITADQVQHFFSEQRTHDANAAIGFGIIHAVRDVDLPRGVEILSLSFGQQ